MPNLLFDELSDEERANPDSFLGDPFKYQNHCQLPEYVELRDRLETWYGSISDEAYRRQLRVRFRRDKTGYMSALSELVVHRLCVVHKLRIEYHRGTGKVPDYVVTDKAGNHATIEVATLSECSQEENRLKRVADKLELWAEELDLRGCGFYFTVWRLDAQCPRKASWLEFVKRQVESFRLVGRCSGNSDYSGLRDDQFELHDVGIYITGSVVVWDDPASPFFVNHVQIQDGMPLERIRGILRKKRPGNYVDLNSPYILALVQHGGFTKPEVFGACLYGDLKVQYDISTHPAKYVQHIYEDDGYWATRRGFKNTRMNALLAVSIPSIIELRHSWASLFMHPCPAATLPSMLGTIAESKLSDSGQVVQELTCLDSILG